MSYSVLWIDHDHAKLFNFTPGGEKITDIKNDHHQNHHTGHFEREKIEQQKKFYADLGNQLSTSQKVLVVGPSQAKTEFTQYLTDHQKNKASTIIGVEILDQLSEGEIRNFAQKYFHKYNLYNP